MPPKRLDPPGFPQTFPSAETIEALHEVMVRCTRCDLFMSRTQVVPGTGPARPRLLLVGEAPGASEDRDGIPFVGRSGALLNAMLDVAGVDRAEVFIANVVRCRPPKNRNPRSAEIRACAGWLDEQIQLLNPPLIVTLGRIALQRLIPKGKITELQAQIQRIELRGEEIAIFPLLHPSAVLRNPQLRQSYEAQFRQLGKLVAA